MKVSHAIAIIAVVCGLGAQAWAQPGAPPPPPPPEGAGAPAPAPMQVVAPPPRQGLMLGLSLGVGSLVADCDECRETFEAGGLDAHIGWMITPRVAIMLDLWGMVHRESFLTVYQNINTIAGQFWVTPRFWLKAGLGNANAGYHWDGIFIDVEDHSESAAGVMVGLGWEALSRPDFAIDLSFRYGTGFYDEEIGDDYVIEGHSAQLGVGFNWF